MSTDWRDFPLYDEEAERDTTLGAILDESRAIAAAGDPETAVEQAIAMAVGLHQGGVDQPALAIVDELQKFVRQGDVAAELWPWVVNARGLALSGLGRVDAARDAFAAMRELAQALPDGPIADEIDSTALQNLGVIEVEFGNAARAVEPLGEALKVKVDLEDWISAIDILNSLALAKAALGDLDDAERTLRDVEELATSIGERRRVASAHGNLGILHTRRGDHAAAETEYREALRLARVGGDVHHEVLGIMNVGSSLAERGREGEALRWYRRGARRAEDLGAVSLEAQLRRSSALMLLRLGRGREARDELERALHLADAVGHPHRSAECRADLGALLLQEGRPAEAEPLLDLARREFAALGDQRWAAQVTNNLAEVALAGEQFALADERWTAAIEALVDDPETTTAIARRAADAAIVRGDVQQARHWINVELSSAEAFEDGADLAWRTATAGAGLNWRLATEDGLELLERAVALYQRAGDDVQAALVRLDVGSARSDLGRHDEAITEFEACLALAHARSDRALRRHALANLGEVLRRNGDLSGATEALTEALQLARALGDDDAVALTLGNLALAYGGLDDLDRAVDAASRQLKLARELKDKHHEASALGSRQHGLPRRAIPACGGSLPPCRRA